MLLGLQMKQKKRKEKKMTQCEMILRYIDTFGSITTKDAFMDLGITRLASRVCDLQKKGIELDRQMETSKNRFGKKVSYMRYSRAKECRE